MSGPWSVWEDPNSPGITYRAIAGGGVVTFEDDAPRVRELRDQTGRSFGSWQTFAFWLEIGNEEPRLYRGAERLRFPESHRRVHELQRLVELQGGVRVTVVFADAEGLPDEDLVKRQPAGWLLNDRTMIPV